MSKLYAIRQTGKSNYWYDFVEDFTSSELDRNCVSNNFAYVKECQNNLGDLNPAWKDSEIVEFREFGEKDDFEDLYYKSLEQRADLEAKLAKKESWYYAQLCENEDLERQLAEHNEYFNLFACKDFDEFKDFISTFMLTPHEEQTLIKELTQQLALKETELGNMQSMYESVSKSSAKYFKENVELREQLAEKDKELNLTKKLLENYRLQCHEFLKNETNICNQDKISFSVEKLEQIKKFLYSGYAVDNEEIEKEIDNQIKQLKEKNDE